MSRVTVFTPTFNRVNTLPRVYNSLCEQTYKDFTWIVVDDGSTDDTKSLIECYQKDAAFEIIYCYQQNSGKHVAINRAVSLTTSELFIIADSDDSFKDIALETFVKAWDELNPEKKAEFKGVICKCYDAETGEDIGTFPGECVDSDELTAGFILKFKFEKWSMFKTDVLREFPFPEPKEKLKFFPETVVWQQMSRKYKTRYINVALRAYYRDQENALTNRKNSRCHENIYLWQHYINDVFDYFQYDKKRFLQAFVGLSRDGILSGLSILEILRMVNVFWRKIIVLVFWPCGAVLAIRKK